VQEGVCFGQERFEGDEARVRANSGGSGALIKEAATFLHFFPIPHTPSQHLGPAVDSCTPCHPTPQPPCLPQA
jgi:hypothetical protein